MKKGTKQERYERYEKFVNALLVLANKSAAARAVGYAPETSHIQAAKLMRNPMVLQILKEKGVDRRLLGENLVRVERNVLQVAETEFLRAVESKDPERIALFGEMIGRHFDRLRSIPGSGIELRARPDPEHSTPNNLQMLIQQIHLYIGNGKVEQPKLEAPKNGNGHAGEWKATEE